MDLRRPVAADPSGDQHARESDGREHRCGDADQQHDRKALDRAGTEHQHDQPRNRVHGVRFEDGAAGFLIAELDRVDDAAPSPLFGIEAASAKFSASEVLPIDGRAASTIISCRWKPKVS